MKKIAMVVLVMAMMLTSGMVFAETSIKPQPRYSKQDKEILDLAKRQVTTIFIYLHEWEEDSSLSMEEAEDLWEFAARLQAEQGVIKALELERDAKYFFEIPIVDGEYDYTMKNIKPGKYLVSMILARISPSGERFALFASVEIALVFPGNMNHLDIDMVPVGNFVRARTQSFPGRTEPVVRGQLVYELLGDVYEWSVFSGASPDDDDDLVEEVFIPWGAKNPKLTYWASDGVVYEYAVPLDFAAEEVYVEYNPESKYSELEFDIDFDHERSDDLDD